MTPEQKNVGAKLIDWARRAAKEILENHGDAAAISTANYPECGFIIEAAKLALTDEGFALQIGAGMELPRPKDRNYVAKDL